MTVHVHKARSRRAQTFLHEQQLHTPQHFEWSKYLWSLPTFLLGIGGYAVTFLMLFSLYPTEVRDVGIQGGYLPLLLSLTWGNLFFIGYMTQNVWRALIYSGFLFFLFAGRLFGIFPFSVVLVCLVSMIMIDLLLTLKKPKR